MLGGGRRARARRRLCRSTDGTADIAPRLRSADGVRDIGRLGADLAEGCFARCLAGRLAVGHR
ncbi:MAG TPA: hypothetical protein VEY67_12600, partial [Candidatus Dormibacteraeota bacterium]|nr:hypothetical protein [Candidatus Dormibacteraeota bacterium]